jgi:hypothetical protein
VFVPPILTQVSTGTCQLTHLGHTGITTIQHINVTTGAQTAEITYEAADGDLLYANNVGQSTPAGPILTFSGTNTVVGGTGKFANATGQFEARGTVNLATGVVSITYEGWIAYDASDRSRR